MRHSKFLLFVILAGDLIFTSGCGGGFSTPSFLPSNENSPSGLDLNSEAIRVLQNNCASCHDNKNTAGTNLTYVADLKQLAASKYVVPGNPSASDLFSRIASGSMPPGNPLHAADQLVIRNWIESLTPAPTPTPSPTPTITPTPTPSVVTYSYINQNILQPKCVGCHGSAGGYSYGSYADTMKAVVAGDANSSPLYSATSAGRMPTSGKLSTQEIQAIYDWIQAGALNN